MKGSSAPKYRMTSTDEHLMKRQNEMKKTNKTNKNKNLSVHYIIHPEKECEKNTRNQHSKISKIGIISPKVAYTTLHSSGK